MRRPLPIRMAEPNPLNLTFRWMSTRGPVGSFTPLARQADAILTITASALTGRPWNGISGRRFAARNVTGTTPA